jgi:hypothetical protein
MASLSGRRCLVVRPVTPSKPFDRSRSGGSERKEGQWIDCVKYPVVESRMTFVYCSPEKHRERESPEQILQPQVEVNAPDRLCAETIFDNRSRRWWTVEAWRHTERVRSFTQG